MRNIAEAAHIDLMDKYLDKLDWQVKENSNMSYSLQGFNNYVASEITKTYWLEKIYPARSPRRAYIDGNVHIHDLNLLSVYCVGWDLMDSISRRISKEFQGRQLVRLLNIFDLRSRSDSEFLLYASRRSSWSSGIQ
jgi:hypothetical protein